MALIIEDGTGVADADSFATLVEASDFALKFYAADFTGETAKKEADLRQAFFYMQGLRWKAGLWPTFGGEIPIAVKRAQIIFAKAVNGKANALSPNVTLGKSKVLTGVDNLKWDVTGPEATVENNRPVITAAFDFLIPHLQSNPARDGSALVAGIMVV